MAARNPRRRVSVMAPLDTAIASESAPTLRTAKTSPSLQPFIIPRKPCKRALLIGIRTYIGSDLPPLKGAHSDVRKMRGLLMDKITVLLDDGVAGHVQPTRVNILNAIKNLVKDVQPGDRLFFHYSGHSTQVPNHSKTEEDDMDECLVPQDGEDAKIVDDELHRRLVAPLPEDSSLVAVLDTCHSGSLLDLRHYRCNRVVVPWRFRGKHDSADMDARYGTVRRNARLATLPPPQPQQPPGGVPPPGPFASSASGSGSRSQVRQSTASSCSSGPIAARIKKALPGLPRLQTRPLTLKEDKNKETADPGHASAILSGLTRVLQEEGDNGVFCESPTAVFCDGWCRKKKTRYIADLINPVKADVISLASCKDSQQAWEGEGGISMTSCLVDLLRKRRDLTLEDVLLSMSHATYNIAVARHASTKKFRLARKQWFRKAWQWITRWERKPPPSPSPAPGVQMGRSTSSKAKAKALRAEVDKEAKASGGDMDCFQNPELSSARPLDMKRKWCM
ncbi:caspase domain-containing protein [Mycena amicta]|nr:caspase domain-containing protein [Mycena amicta]